jgi:hypothetical protein
MITRRSAITTGLAAASALWAGGLRASTLRPAGHDEWSIDALLVDQNVQMSRQADAVIAKFGRTLPVLAIRLDAAGHSDLMRTFSTSRTIAGISSGATLFCLERLAWDHGYRLIQRTQHLLGPLNDMPAQECADYRPSHVDGALHLWVMRNRASSLGLSAKTGCSPRMRIWNFTAIPTRSYGVRPVSTSLLLQ